MVLTLSLFRSKLLTNHSNDCTEGDEEFHFGSFDVFAPGVQITTDDFWRYAQNIYRETCVQNGKFTFWRGSYIRHGRNFYRFPDSSGQLKIDVVCRL